jgi:hypothetical protein
MKTLFRILAATALFVLAFAVVPKASAQAASSGNSIDTHAALDEPNTQSGVVTGLNEVLRYVFLFLKFLAIVACGWGSYQMWKGEFTSGIWSYIAALALFFAPALVDLAQNIGRTAVNN